MNKKFVLFIEGADNGCNWYRLRQPMEFLQKRENFYCASTVDLKDRNIISEWMNHAHIVMTQASQSERMLDLVKDHKQKFVFDFDDNVFDVSPYNPAYRQFGVSDVQIDVNGEKKMLWQDGANGFDIQRNIKGIELFTEMLKNCDMVTTPSTTLGNVFRSKGAKNVRIIKNYLDFNVWNPLSIVKDDFVRIGYQGGWSHYEDWYEIGDAIRTVMDKHKNVKLVLMGQEYGGILKQLPEDRVELHSWVNIGAYPYKFKTLNIDIGVCPLANTEFNVCKSELKWEEYSSLKIPTIASNVPPYSIAIDHEKTGLLAKDKNEWIEYLERLILDKEYRKKLGENAYRRVREDYDMENHVDKYENVFNSVLNKNIVLKCFDSIVNKLK